MGPAGVLRRPRVALPPRGLAAAAGRATGGTRAMHVCQHRALEGRHIVVGSDGACGQRSRAYAAVLADARGVLADAWSAVAVEDPYPWAAEWFGGYVGLTVFREMRLPLTTRVLALADNTHVTTEEEDHAVSDIPYVDDLRVQYAAGLHREADEGYVPAQQDFASGAPSPAPGLASLHSAQGARFGDVADVGRGRGPHAIHSGCWRRGGPHDGGPTVSA